MDASQVVKRVKYKSSVKAPGVDGILKMTRERFTFRPNDPSTGESFAKSRGFGIGTLKPTHFWISYKFQTYKVTDLICVLKKAR